MTDRAMTTDRLVDEVKSHAVKHYDEGGWDVVVECWSDDEIRDTIGASKTVRGALRNMKAVVLPYGEHRNEIRSLAF